MPVGVLDLVRAQVDEGPSEDLHDVWGQDRPHPFGLLPAAGGSEEGVQFLRGGLQLGGGRGGLGTGAKGIGDAGF